MQAIPARRHLARSAGAIAFVLLLVGISTPSQAAQVGLCKFDTTQFKFQGTSSQQTTCLLRFVKPKGTGSTLQTIPAWLTSRVGQQTKVTPAALQTYLANNNIPADQIGGPIPTNPDIAEKRYLVIHDTSTELPNAASFPSNINTPGWSGNGLNGWADTAQRVNVITNRVGASRTLRDFTAARPKPATKLEQSNNYPAARKHFVHVENIQPRLKPAGSWFHVAPDPGFSQPQLARLALVYVAASVRSGRWLVPAFHFNVDTGVGDAHDDPQKFVLADWVLALESLVASIGETN